MHRPVEGIPYVLDAGVRDEANTGRREGDSPTPTASSYSIVGYATMHRYCTQRDQSQTLTVKNDASRHQKSHFRASCTEPYCPVSHSPHTTAPATALHLYTTIHAARIVDPTILNERSSQPQTPSHQTGTQLIIVQAAAGVPGTREFPT